MYLKGGHILKTCLLRIPGKEKAASRSKPARKSRRNAGDGEPAQPDHSSSSWHGSSDSESNGGGSCSDDNGRQKRTGNPRAAASNTTAAPRPARRRGISVKPGGGGGRHPAGRRRTPSALERRDSARSGSRRLDSASSHVGTESDEDEAEFEISSRPRRPERAAYAAAAAAAAAPCNPGKEDTAKRRGGSRTAEAARSIRSNGSAGATSSAQRSDSRGNDDDDDDDDDSESDFRLSSPRAAGKKSTKESARSGDSGTRGGGLGGSGGGRSAANSAMVDLLSEDDANECLRNTDSDDGSAAGGDDARGGGVGSGGGDGGSSGAPVTMTDLLSDDDAGADCLRDTDSDAASAASGDGGHGPVLCRCGARDWKDKARWIQCDARECRTWEHLMCAYPVGDDPGGEGAPPEVHLCQGCSAKGSSAASGKARRGGRRCLTRCGDGATPSPPTKTNSDDALRDGDDGSGAGGAETSRVRRSQRVSGKEKRRVPLKKNVVGEEPLSSSSDGMGVGPSGLLTDDRDPGGSDDDDDEGFWAPEGKVEISQEYRCRCGETLPDGDGGDVSGGKWVQCRSDHCRVWEHAACCEHGCSSPAPSAATSHARRHWCRACDPRGKKHARWEERMRKKARRERAAKRAGAGAARAGSASVAETEAACGNEKSQVDERTLALLGDIRRAVISGNASLLEELFREADGGTERPEMSVERLLEAAGQPPPMRCSGVRSSPSGGGGDGGTEAGVADDDESPVRGGCPLPAGLSLLMLAAGYWSNVADTSAASVGATAATAAATTAPARAEGAAETTPLVLDVPSEGPKPDASGRSAVDRDPEAAVPGSPPAAANAADAITGTGAAAVQNEARTEKDASADPAGVAAPRASAESLIAAASTTGLPQLGSEARLAVLRLVLESSGARAVLAADGEGRTALHHAAAVNGAAEAALLLEGELGAKAALAKVNLARRIEERPRANCTRTFCRQWRWRLAFVGKVVWSRRRWKLRRGIAIALECLASAAPHFSFNNTTTHGESPGKTFVWFASLLFLSERVPFQPWARFLPSLPVLSTCCKKVAREAHAPAGQRRRRPRRDLRCSSGGLARPGNEGDGAGGRERRRRHLERRDRPARRLSGRARGLRPGDSGRGRHMQQYLEKQRALDNVDLSRNPKHGSFFRGIGCAVFVVSPRCSRVCLHMYNTSAHTLTLFRSFLGKQLV